MSLLLSTYEKNSSVVSAQAFHEIVCLFDFLNCLLQVNNVNTVSFSEDKFVHFRVPTTSLVTEVYPSFQKLFHGDNCHLHTPPKFGFLCALRPVHLPLRLSIESTLNEIPKACVLTPSITITYHWTGCNLFSEPFH
ncbi:hypothetical protein E6C60_2478 [Paenibacillus algicola]|uniref:Uncharacterized protein n=1 Tax=Paenibacillus algicola TaxID=2565926 RepID=A0A4P8XNA8_9BACL|nr:hypothetical protein E6C60_2478 [Paenibacillus algicola]